MQTIKLYIGKRWAPVLTWKASGVPVNLTSYTVQLALRKNRNSDEAVKTLSSAVPGEITLGGVAGTISPVIPATATALFAPGLLLCGISASSGGGDEEYIAEFQVEVIQPIER